MRLHCLSAPFELLKRGDYRFWFCYRSLKLVWCTSNAFDPSRNRGIASLNSCVSRNCAKEEEKFSFASMLVEEPDGLKVHNDVLESSLKEISGYSLACALARFPIRLRPCMRAPCRHR